jgi:hypothetical protein
VIQAEGAMATLLTMIQKLSIVGMLAPLLPYLIQTVVESMHD